MEGRADDRRPRPRSNLIFRYRLKDGQMYSITMNLMSPKDWRDKLSAFVERLEREFDGRLRLVIALPTPDDRLYESNVLIVLDEVRKEDSIVVASAAPEDVSPLLVPQEDRDAIEAFKLLGGRVVFEEEVG